jgi:hypothetical protein
LTGEQSLREAVNLGGRGLMRIAVDGGRPIDIDVAGTVPAQTAADEIVSQINRVFSNLAALNADDKLLLTSPTTGPGSSVSLQPLRFLEVLEYPLRAAPELALQVKHNGSWPIVNDGVADTYAEIKITAPQGTVGPSLVNSGSGWSVHLFIVLERGETARVFRDALLGLQAEVIAPDGQTHPVAGTQILIGPTGAQTWVPFEGTWRLSGDGHQPPALQLNNPQAPNIVRLKALARTDEVTVTAAESDISSLPAAPLEADGKLQGLVGRVKSDHGVFWLIDGHGSPIVEVLAGPHIHLWNYVDKVVKVQGFIFRGTPPSILVQRITELFDVRLERYHGIPESYPGVSIGTGTADADSLVRQINAGSERSSASALVRAEELDKTLVLKIPSGKTIFRYLDCLGSRFDYAHFDHARFPDGVCGERGIFDVSRFSNSPPERIRAVFASADPFSDPPVQISFRWEKFSAGSFVVNLPADLPPRFGGRFDEARFSQEKDSPELYERAVAEPVDDERFLVKLLEKSNFVKATVVSSLELGWSPVHLPFRKPQFLTLGGPSRAARLYLTEDGLAGFIKLEAKEEGTWGNDIAVSARLVGPAIYDVSVIYRGARFEQARSIVFGAVKETINEFLQPGPIGVLQAKAAGVRANITRDRADYNQLPTTN